MKQVATYRSVLHLRPVSESLDRLPIYPRTHYVTPRSQLLKAIDSIRAELDPRLAELNEAGKLLGEEGRLRYSLAPSVATPKILASKVVHRGVGISRTRT